MICWPSETRPPIAHLDGGKTIFDSLVGEQARPKAASCATIIQTDIFEYSSSSEVQLPPVRLPRRCVRVSQLALALLAIALHQAPNAHAQAAAGDSTYDPRLTFAPLTLPDPVNAYRSSNGAPGPSYWQNEADYELHATLDTTAKQLHTDEIITYTNNSPDTLTSLWIQLEQNIYRKDSRGHDAFNSAGVVRRRCGMPDRSARRTDHRRLRPRLRRNQVRQATRPRPTTSSATRACRSASPTRSSAHGAAQDPHQVPLPDPRRLGRPHLVGHVQARRDLRHGPVVPAHVRLRRPARLGHAALPRQRVLPRIRPLRLLRHRAVEHDRRRLRRAGEPQRRPDRQTQIARLAQARNSDKTVFIRTADEVERPRQPPQAGRHADLALPHGPHPRRRLVRLARLRLGRRAHQPARRQERRSP